MCLCDATQKRVLDTQELELQAAYISAGNWNQIFCENHVPLIAESSIQPLEVIYPDCLFSNIGSRSTYYSNFKVSYSFLGTSSVPNLAKCLVCIISFNLYINQVVIGIIIISIIILFYDGKTST